MPRNATNYQPTPELTQVTAAPNIQTQQASADPRANSAFQLAEALGVAAPQLEKFNAEWQQRKQDEQAQKIGWYVEQFGRDHKDGAVGKAQVKEVFPEVVPVIASRIAEEVGKKHATDKMGDIINEINTNDALRLDTSARKAFIDGKRRELLGEVKPGNEFYAAGFVKGMDGQLSQYEHAWGSETAQYHQKVQTEGFSKAVATALNGDGDLLAEDQAWGKSSSLNNIERKKIVVATAVDVALASDDPAVLDKVPQLFQGPDSKALFARTKLQIQEHRMSTFRYGQQMQEYQRAEELRKGKKEIVDTLAGGGSLDPKAYAKNPELFQYAIQMRDTPLVDEAVSKAAASAFEQSLLTSATLGDTGNANDIMAALANHNRINAKDKAPLMEKIPKLLEGRQLMKDDVVRQQFNDRLDPLFKMAETSVNGMLGKLNGKSPRTDVMKSFDNDIQRSFTAYYEENGKWPSGFQKKELVDKAIERAEVHFEKISSIYAAQSAGSPAKPNKPVALPKGVTKIE
jgi:hypothetical protein